MRTKHFQLWIHQNYDSIKLTLVGLTFLFVVIMFFSQLQRDLNANHAREQQLAQESRARQENLKAALDYLDERTADINDKADYNTKLIVCLLAIHGESDLITSEDEASCRKLIEDGPQTTSQTERDRREEARIPFPENSPIPAPEQNRTDPTTPNSGSPAPTDDGLVSGEDPVTNILERTINMVSPLPDVNL